MGLGCSFLLIAVAQTALAQTTPAHPVKVKRGGFEVQCKYGAADSTITPIGLTFGTDVVAAQRRVEGALRKGHLRTQPGQFLVWTVKPIDRWPAGPDGDQLRGYPHPGVFATLLLARKGDSVIVVGHTEALCASAPEAPDSTVATARRFAADSIMHVLERGRPQ